MTIDAYLDAMKERFVTDPLVTLFHVKHEFTSRLIFWYDRIHQLPMNPSRTSLILHVCALAVLNSMILCLFLLRLWLPILPPMFSWRICSTMMTASGAQQERQKVLQG